MTPLTLPAIVLTLAALGGATMAVIRLRGAPYPPLWMAVGHGVIAVTGVGILAYRASEAALPELAQYALGVFVVAALGGLVLFGAFHVKRRPLPIPLVVVHGLIGLTGLGLLLTSVYRGG